MSVDEDTELRDLVAQTLETNGVLGKIRAQLRANVFLALEEQDAAKNKPPYVNPELKKFLGTNEGRMVTSLVREFLQFFDLEYTLAVFDPEIGLGEHYESRANLAREYNIIESNVSDSAKAPLLVEVVKRGAGDPTVLKGRTSSTTTESKPGNLPDISEKSPRTPTSPKTPSEKDDDSFFDDPLPDNSREKEISGSFKKDSETKGAGGSAMSSLAGLPSLVGTQNNGNNESTTPRMPDITKEDLADIDKHVGNDDDYDEDFESSNPMGATPRSARSDHNVKSMEDEEIEEDIQEEISIVDDFLKSDNSGADDLTTDRTVSPTDQSTAFDYMEEVIS